MDNPEEVLHSLDEFAKLKPKNIPRELEDYLMYVARTGDPVYQWPVVKCLFREKLLNVITEFYENTPTLDLPPSPNVDPFNYESMKNVLLERLEAFPNAPFTVQRLCELLTTPHKEYNRPDKFMRAIEKNILVVSTREPGSGCRPDSALSEPIPNGVSDPPDASSNQPSSSEDGPSEKSDASPSIDSVENHLSTESDQSNHVDSEPSGSSIQEMHNDDLKSYDHEEISESIGKDDNESSDASDDGEKSSEAFETFDSADLVKDSCLDPDPMVAVNSPSEKSSDVPEQSATLPEQSAALPDPCSDPSDQSSVGPVQASSPSADASELESSSVVASTEPSSSDVVSESDQDNIPSGSNEVRGEIDIHESKDDSVADSIAELSKAEPCLSELPEQLETTEDVKDSSTEAIAPETSICSSVQEQLADSTATESGKSETASEALASDSSESALSSSTADPTADQEKSNICEGSEALPALSDSDKDIKEKVATIKVDEDVRITSTDRADEEAMEVDESSNQAASTAEADAMEVGEEEEPMDVCEDSPSEEMTTSPQEAAQ